MHALLGADPRPALRTVSLHPKPSCPQICTCTQDLGPFLDNMFVCLAHQDGSECALSQKSEVLNHVASSLVIYLVQLHPTIDVTFTKQPKTKLEKFSNFSQPSGIH